MSDTLDALNAIVLDFERPAARMRVVEVPFLIMSPVNVRAASRIRDRREGKCYGWCTSAWMQLPRTAR